MDVAKELANYLDNAGFGTAGTDIHVAQIPAKENGIYISHLGGTSNNYLALNETVLDVYVKNTSAQTCIDTLNNIKNFIHRMHSTEINNAYFYSILVISEPENVDRDLEYAKLFKITVSIINRDTSLIS